MGISFTAERAECRKCGRVRRWRRGKRLSLRRRRARPQLRLGVVWRAVPGLAFTAARARPPPDPRSPRPRSLAAAAASLSSAADQGGGSLRSRPGQRRRYDPSLSQCVCVFVCVSVCMYRMCVVAGGGSSESEGDCGGGPRGRAQYVSANCVVFTHYSGDVAAVVDDHFTRALSLDKQKGTTSTTSPTETMVRLSKMTDTTSRVS